MCVCVCVCVCVSVCEGPKIEYLLINLMAMSLMLALYMTGSMAVVYVTSALMGLARATMYTVPFMLANNICHREVSQKEDYVCPPPPPPLPKGKLEKKQQRRESITEFRSCVKVEVDVLSSRP